MTLPQVRKQARELQAALDLQGWRITVRLAVGDECADCHAFVQSQKGRKPKATIIVATLDEYALYWLVHELMHVVLSGLVTEVGKMAEQAEEEAVERLTNAYCVARGIACPPDAAG